MKQFITSIVALLALAAMTACAGQSDNKAEESTDSTAVDQPAASGNDLLVECEAFTIERLSDWEVSEVHPEHVNIHLPAEKQGEYYGIIDWYVTGYKRLDDALKDYVPGGKYESTFKIRPDQMKLGDLSYTVLERDDNNFLYAQLPDDRGVLKIELWTKLVDDPDVQKMLSSFKLK